jgi:hypothetical protein
MFGITWRSRFHILLMAVGAVFLAVQTGGATTLTGNLTADNAFFAYISTSNSTLGTLVASGNDWGTTFSIDPTTLTPGVTYYLHIEAINYGGPGAVLGEFSLSDSDFYFANGSQTLLTDTTDWSGGFNDDNSDPNSSQPWVTPTGAVTSFGENGVGPWGTRPGISGSADWIWPSDPTSYGCGTGGYPTNGDCTVDISTTIYSTVSEVPEPSTVSLFMVGGLALLVARQRLGFTR